MTTDKLKKLIGDNEIKKTNNNKWKITNKD